MVCNKTALLVWLDRILNTLILFLTFFLCSFTLKELLYLFVSFVVVVKWLSYLTIHFCKNLASLESHSHLATSKSPSVWNCLPLSCYLIHLLRNLYAGQEATVRTGHGTTDWFQIGKGVHQGCILSPCLFNLYAEYIMKNAGLDEAQAGIKIARRNINNLRYVDDTTLMAESEDELKSLLKKWKRRLKKLA